MFLAATGMVCPVGLGAESSCAALRAGLAKFDELPYHDNHLQPVIGAAVPGLPLTLRHEVRLVELLAGAVRDCLGEKPALATAGVPLVIGLAEPQRPGGGGGLENRIVGLVQDRLGLRFHPTLSRGVARGHTAGFEAFRAARELLDAGSVSACVVCGVDSYVNANALLWLDQNRRLKTPLHSDGVIPGEAAAAVLVQQAAPADKPAVRLAGLGFAVEKAHVLSEEPLLGLGLTEAAKKALAEAGRGMHEIDWRLSDVTGESYGFKEQSLALTRTLRVRREEMRLRHTADAIGDVGAAVGVCQAVIACHAFRKWPDAGTHVACYTSAVPGDRGVMILQTLAD
jgi:3-oxoacyl-[acyl-carrier-protein] synthase-1